MLTVSFFSIAKVKTKTRKKKKDKEKGKKIKKEEGEARVIWLSVCFPICKALGFVPASWTDLHARRMVQSSVVSL